jgi:ribonuclease HI
MRRTGKSRVCGYQRSFLHDKHANVGIAFGGKLLELWDQRSTRLLVNLTPKMYVRLTKALLRLSRNKPSNAIVKWDTKLWGDVPADYGRK